MDFSYSDEQQAVIDLAAQIFGDLASHEQIAGARRAASVGGSRAGALKRLRRGDMRQAKGGYQPEGEARG